MRTESSFIERYRCVLRNLFSHLFTRGSHRSHSSHLVGEIQRCNWERGIAPNTSVVSKILFGIVTVIVTCLDGSLQDLILRHPGYFSSNLFESRLEDLVVHFTGVYLIMSLNAGWFELVYCKVHNVSRNSGPSSAEIMSGRPMEVDTQMFTKASMSHPRNVPKGK